MSGSELVIRGKRIGQDENGFLCLTDMWQLAGANKSKTPASWRRLPTTKELLAVLSDDVRFSHVIKNSAAKSAIYSTVGRRAATYAIHILGLGYAEYLDPQLGIEVREIALRVWGGDVSVLDDYSRERRDQADEDGKRVFMRDDTRWYNQVLNARVQDVGGKTPRHFASFHNSGYRGLYAGMEENDIHRKKELKKDQKILDFMTSPEAAANWFRTTQAEQRLRYYPVETLEEACAVHHNIGERVRDFMKTTGSPMPEDMPTADSIGDAKRRLREDRKSTEPAKKLK